MRALSTTELFSVWEETLDQPLLSKTILLLSTACSVADNKTIATLSIGERDARLFLLREWMFGTRMFHTATCPACSEKMEWETATTDLRVQSFDDNFSPKIFKLSSKEFTIQYRLVNSLDIIQLLKSKIPAGNSKEILLQNCVEDVKKSGKNYRKSKLPAEIINAVEEEMAKTDPQADVQLNLSCSACNHQWQVGFDIMSFFWTEINNWAQRLMHEIFLLARFFNWAEKDILAMSPRRRHLYLKMING